jgi:hypothetical protein
MIDPLSIGLEDQDSAAMSSMLLKRNKTIIEAVSKL